MHQRDSCRRNDVSDVPSASELDVYAHVAWERGRRTMCFRLHGDDGFQFGGMLFRGPRGISPNLIRLFNRVGCHAATCKCHAHQNPASKQIQTNACELTLARVS